jgi:hypothetical protein
MAAAAVRTAIAIHKAIGDLGLSRLCCFYRLPKGRATATRLRGGNGGA